MSAESIDVAFCCDETYVQPLLVAMYSLLRTARDPVKLRIWIFGKQLSLAASARLEKLVQQYGATLQTISAEGVESQLRSVHLDGYWSLATYYRLFLPEVLPATVTRLLYLDCDLIVRRPVEDLYSQSLDNRPVAAVFKAAPGDVRHLGLSRGEDYFNAGVLLMDLERWRGKRLHRAVLYYIAAHPDHLQFADQDPLNAVLAGDWKRLDPRWNQQFRFYTQTAAEIGITSEELLRIRADPYIVHFTTGSKPWQAGNAHPFRKEFRALAQTQVREWRPHSESPSEAVATFCKRAIPPRYWPAVLRNRYRPKYHRIKARFRSLV